MTTRRRSDKRGQALPLFVILVPGILALMALGIDGANVFLAKRDAQGAADLAAVSGAKLLPDAAAAETQAELIGQANGYSALEVSHVTPYNGDNQAIEVTIDREVPTYFMPVLNFFGVGDFSKWDVSARAVAKSDPGATSSGNYAVDSLMPCGIEEDFEALEWQGNGNTVIGSVHSNAGADFSGNGNGVSEEFSIECIKSELYDNGKDSFTMTGDNSPGITGSTGEPPACTGSEGPGVVCRKAVDDPPYPQYNASNLDNSVCDHIENSDFDFDGSYAPGVYCVKGKAVIKDGTTTSASRGSPGMTIIAHEFDIPGKNIELWAYQDNLLFYAYKDYPNRQKDEVITISGDNCDGDNDNFGDPGRGYLKGLIMAPYGEVKFPGNCFDVEGGLLGWRAEWSGDKNHIKGELGSSVATPPTIAIIE